MKVNERNKQAMMDAARKARLAEKGILETTVKEWLGLSDAEAEMIEIYVALSSLIKTLRKRARLSQAQLAARLGADQSTVSRLETNAPSLSLELLFRAAFAVGATRQQIAQALGK
jgi:DNA-binding XRE family transcriptional regulator